MSIAFGQGFFTKHATSISNRGEISIQMSKSVNHLEVPPFARGEEGDTSHHLGLTAHTQISEVQAAINNHIMHPWEARKTRANVVYYMANYISQASKFSIK